jgi:hypothetical protein
MGEKVIIYGKEMLKHSDGVRKVPVIIEEGKVTIGYAGGS